MFEVVFELYYDTFRVVILLNRAVNELQDDVDIHLRGLPLHSR